MSVYVGGNRLELSVLGPCSAGMPAGLLFLGVWGAGLSVLPLFIVLEKGQTALGPYKYLFKLLLPYLW